MEFRTDVSNSTALQVCGVNKFYGRGTRAYHVLRSLDMEVPQGTIYGLLGPSGCGKTTLLRCVLGRLPIHSGHIRILGKSPGTRGHSVPGKGVGYMPQELALQMEMTLRETMYYFGILFKMNLKYVNKRTDFLKKFLNISSANTLCGKFSGGEKRRISLAVALLHEPPLLILDEPTVGVDTLLRAKIWDHLLDITSTGNNTIIITTHYIEEARQAHVVGLMRSGRLLAEAKPDDLISTYSVLTLEDVFLKLSGKQDHDVRQKAAKGASIQQGDDDPSEHTPLLSNSVDTVQYPSYFSGVHLSIPRIPRISNIAAQSWKEVLKFVRQPLTFFFLLLNPTIQLSLFNLAYGNDITNIKVYYSNYDSGVPDFACVFPHPHGLKFISSLYMRDKFHIKYIGPDHPDNKSFLSHIDGDTLDLKRASSLSEGIDKIEEGSAWGYFSIPGNYTNNFIDRLVTVCDVVNTNRTVHPSELSGAAIELILDVTNSQIYYTINNTLNKAVVGMRSEFLRNTSIPDYYFNPPLTVRTYVYGGSDLRVTDFSATGLIAGVTLSISILLTVTNLIVERTGGLFDRSWVAGVSIIEVVTSQMVVYAVLGLLQVIVMTLTTIYAFDIAREGSIPLVIFLGFVEVLCGLSLGLVLSTLFANVEVAVNIAGALFFPLMNLGGVLWPIESFDKWLQVVSRLSPESFPADGVRSILLKGWSFADEPIYFSFVVLIVWTVICLLTTCVGLQIKKF